MTDDQIRIAVAEACGWKKEYIHGNGIDDEVWICPKTNQCWLAEDAALPDYLNDLNACAEFEKTLTDKEHFSFRKHLWDIVIKLGPEDTWDRQFVSADAKTRCIAYLKTKGIIP